MGAFGNILFDSLKRRHTTQFYSYRAVSTNRFPTHHDVPETSPPRAFTLPFAGVSQVIDNGRWVETDLT